jgi:hypothetical protein
MQQQQLQLVSESDSPQQSTINNQQSTINEQTRQQKEIVSISAQLSSAPQTNRGVCSVQCSVYWQICTIERCTIAFLLSLL